MGLDNKKTGQNIKFYRNKKGLSQEELGEIVFASSTHISYLETGAKTPSLELLVLIANALDVSADDLLVGSLKNTSSSVGKEIHELLQKCSHDEEEILTRILFFMKELFSEYGI